MATKKKNPKTPTKLAGPRRPGRPPNPNLPREQFWMRLGADEREKWQAAADRLGLDLSSWIRMQCNQAVQP